MLQKIRKFIELIENTNTSFFLFISAFLAIIFVRTLAEGWLAGFEERSAWLFIYEFYHKFFFFLIAFIPFAILLKKSLGVSIKKISNILLFGYLVLIIPPIIDHYLSGGKGYWSFYDFGSLPQLIKYFFTFFDDTPEMGITYGVRFEIAFSLFFIFLYSWIKLSIQNSKFKIQNFNLKFIKQIFLKSIIITLVAYVILYFLGTFPSWFTILFDGFSKGFLNTTDVDTARMFITPGNILSHHINDFVSALNVKLDIVYSLILTLIIFAIFWKTEKQKLVSFINNFRFPQVVFHCGIFLVGIGLGIYFSEENFSLSLFNILALILALQAVVCAWLASVVINDFEDEAIDEIANSSRPLPQKIFSPSQYASLGIFLFIASIVFSSIVNPIMALFMVFYQALAWIYSASPLRLKRFPIIATFISSIALIMVLFSGYTLVSSGQDLAGLPFSMIVLLIITYTFSIPTKDLKDIEGDKRNGVFTIPVIFGEKWGRIIIGSGIFLSYMLSVNLLHEPRLFWWAAIAGGASYWMMNNQKIHPKRLPWWIMGIVSIYGIILVNIVFLK